MVAEGPAAGACVSASNVIPTLKRNLLASHAPAVFAHCRGRLRRSGKGAATRK